MRALQPVSPIKLRGPVRENGNTSAGACKLLNEIVAAEQLPHLLPEGTSFPRNRIIFPKVWRLPRQARSLVLLTRHGVMKETMAARIIKGYIGCSALHMDVCMANKRTDHNARTPSARPP